jgi:glucokinase
MNQPGPAIGIDIGGTNVKAVYVRAAGTIVARQQLETGDATNAWRDTIRTIVRQLEAEHGAARFIGVSAPGIARPDGTGIAWMIGRMEGVVDFDFTSHLGRRERVPVLNDGLAALLGEVWLGAGRGLSDVVMYTLGTGVGGAIYSGGKLLRGHTGRAGHLGHATVDATGPKDICNTPGSIEYHIGNYSLAERTAGAFDDTAAMLQTDRGRVVWNPSIDKLAAAIASVINILDPQRVILGGGMIAAGDALFVPLRAAMDRYEWRPLGSGVPIVPAELGEWAGALGAAKNAMEQA